MKKLILLLLICPFYSMAQRNETDSVFIKSIPADLGKPIHMPELDYNPDFNLDKIFGYRERIRIFLIREDSVYKKLFSRYIYTADSLKKYKEDGDYAAWFRWMKQYQVDSLPVIDFSKNELVLYSACEKCLEVCNHKNGSESCHRAGCDFKEAWFIRKRKG